MTDNGLEERVTRLKEVELDEESMTEEVGEKTQNPASDSDGYFHGDGDEHRQGLADRRAEEGPATFFLPHLKQGMRLLDCGCGPGSITIGLAKAVAPGEAVGLDQSPRFVEAARNLAEEEGVSNVQFEQGDVYSLPFPDASFDAVFAHTLLVHLRDPTSVLEEMLRVLRPGGVIGIRDNDWGSRVWAPLSPLLERFSELSVRALDHLGASPRYARRQRELLQAAGFARSEAAATAVCAGSPASLSKVGPRLLAQVRQPGFQKIAVQEGWVEEEELEAMEQAIAEWIERPDAFFAVLVCEAVGWAPEA